ncbi:MAG TPA: hypothetical protein VFV28_08530, partial [Limnobacter sp.]|nr:hypothetical protein [Limnobacter sp.]
MTPDSEVRNFGWQFFLLALASLAITFWVTFRMQPPALNSPSVEAQAYLFEKARVLFSEKPDLRPAEILSGKTKQLVSLPDNWDTTRPGFEGQGWYQIDFNLDDGKPLPDAVFIPKAVMNAHAYMNGQWIGGLGRMEGELTRHWNYPYLFQFSTDLLKPGRNSLLVQVAGYRNYRSGIGRVWVGKIEQLQPMYESTYRWQVTGSMLATLVAFCSGLLLLLLFARLFDEKRGFVFLSLAVIAFSIRNTGYFLDWTPLPHAQWAQLVQSLHAWFAAFYCLFMVRYMKLDWSWTSWVLPGYATVITVLTFTAGGADMQHFTLALLTPVLPMVFALNMMLLAKAWKHTNLEAAILGCASLLFVLLSLRDLATMTGWVPIESILVSQYSGLLFFISACWIIFRRYQALL